MNKYEKMSKEELEEEIKKKQEAEMEKKLTEKLPPRSKPTISFSGKAVES